MIALNGSFTRTRNLRSLLGEFYTQGSFVFSIEAFAAVGLSVVGDAQMVKENEATLSSYLQVYEQDVARLLLGGAAESPQMALTAQVCRDNCQAMLARGALFAPRIEGVLPESREEVDGALLQAIRNSVSEDHLMQKEPAFCSWF